MSEDQFNQIIAKLAIINNVASEANSIARGTAILLAILYDKFGIMEQDMVKLTERVAALEPKKTNGHTV